MGTLHNLDYVAWRRRYKIETYTTEVAKGLKEPNIITKFRYLSDLWSSFLTFLLDFACIVFVLDEKLNKVQSKDFAVHST